MAHHAQTYCNVLCRSIVQALRDSELLRIGVHNDFLGYIYLRGEIVKQYLKTIISDKNEHSRHPSAKTAKRKIIDF